LLYWDTDSIKTYANQTKAIEEYNQSLTKVLEISTSKIKHVILGGPTLYGEKPRGNNSNDAMLDYYSDINREICATYGVLYIESRDIFFENLPPGWDQHQGYLTLDGEHYNRRGVLLEANMFTQVLRQVMLLDILDKPTEFPIISSHIVPTILPTSLSPSQISIPTKLDLHLFLNNDTIDKTEIDPLAICNDGSVGGYFYKPATDPKLQNTYLVYLRGGGQCYDEVSCQARNTSRPDLMSSLFFPSSITYQGIFDSNPYISPYAGAHMASLAYCSSDGYIGDAPASEDTWGWHFRGQRLVRQFILTLISKHGLVSGSTVLLAGGSAGARGMMSLADLIISQYLPAGIRVACWLDSPYYIDMLPYNNSIPSFQYQEQQKWKHMNTLATIPFDCFHRYNPENATWKCQFGQYRMPYVTSPYFLIASQNDQYQLDHDTGEEPSGEPLSYSNPDILTYANAFGNWTQKLFGQLAKDHEMGNVEDAFFSQACYNHDTSISNSFYTLKAPVYNKTSNQDLKEYTTMRDALITYLGTNPYMTVSNSLFPSIDGRALTKTQQFIWFDLCTGFQCGLGC
jgi:hypothetical protein